MRVSLLCCDVDGSKFGILLALHVATVIFHVVHNDEEISHWSSD